MDQAGLGNRVVLCRAGPLDMVGTVMGICQKCFIDTNKILDHARETLCYSQDPIIMERAQAIIKCINDPIGDLPLPSVETTMSRQVVRHLQTDVLGHEGTITLQVGGYDKYKWYRLDLPRGFALRLLNELEDEWLHGPDQATRGMCRRAYKTLKKNLGV